MRSDPPRLDNWRSNPDYSIEFSRDDISRIDCNLFDRDASLLSAYQSFLVTSSPPGHIVNCLIDKITIAFYMRRVSLTYPRFLSIWTIFHFLLSSWSALTYLCDFDILILYILPAMNESSSFLQYFSVGM